MGEGLVYLILGVGWICAAAGGGAVLALLACRANPALPFRRLWAFYAALLGLGSGAFFIIAIR
ncbi:MAG TPA: hypothetical protein VF192_06570 [Longimicrobiales bacterium]